MASVFKRKYTKVVDGKKVKKQSQKYYTRLTDADGIKRTIPLFTDRTASEQQAAQLQKGIELAKAGVVDRYKEHRTRPLVEHLEDFRQQGQNQRRLPGCRICPHAAVNNKQQPAQIICRSMQPKTAQNS
jgi:hypothetical protein